MSSRGLLTALCTLVMAGGCAQRSRPIALDARPADREALQGVWRGTYSIEGRRGGVIDFELAPGEPQARGDILLIARGAFRPGARGAAEAAGPGVAPAATELLTFRFVRAADGRLDGSVSPYWDPDRGCRATATFAGTIARGAMAGTLTSTCDDGGPRYLGRGSMRRVTGRSRAR